MRVQVALTGGCTFGAGIPRRHHPVLQARGADEQVLSAMKSCQFMEMNTSQSRKHASSAICTGNSTYPDGSNSCTLLSMFRLIRVMEACIPT